MEKILSFLTHKYQTHTKQGVCKLLMAMMFCFPMLGQAQCPDVLDETNSFIDFGEIGSPIAGCTEIKFCVRLFALDNPVNDVDLTFSFSPNGTGDFMNVVDLGGYSQNSSTNYTQEIDLPAETTQIVCISFQIDSDISTNITDKIEGQVEVLPPGCTTPDVFDFGTLLPDYPRFVVEGTVSAADFATGTSGTGTGNMLEPDMSDDIGQVILVNGSLVFDLDEPYYFPLGSDILMGPDASIIIEENNTLFLLERARIIGCTEMWDRVEVQDGGVLYIDGTPSGSQNPGTVLVRDGENGIRLNDGATLLTGDANFLNNWRSFSTDVNIDSKNFSFIIDGNNTVTSDGGLLPPHAGRLPLAGMDFYGLNGVNIIGSAGNTIEFSNLARGVRLTWSTSTLEKLLFHDILDDPATVYNVNSTEGTAVYANGLGAYRTLRYVGFGTTANDMLDCRNGIRADDMNLYAYDARMDRVNRGVDVRRSDGRNVVVEGCDITARNHGVGLFSNMPASVDVKGNAILAHDETNTTNSATGFGIRAEEVPIGTDQFQFYLLHDNLIELDNAETGLRFQSGLGPFILGNTVDMVDADRETYFGFDLQGTAIPFAYCNLMLGNGTAQAWNGGTAFNAVALSEARIRCNDVQDTDIGFRFTLDGQGSGFSGNSINEHRLGLFLDVDAALGPQVHQGNLWLGTSYAGGQNGNWGAYVGTTNPDQSRLTVDPIDNNGDFLTSTNNDDLFLKINNDPTPNYSCAVENTCPNGVGSTIEDFIGEGPGGINALDHAIADGSITYSECDTAMLWTAQRRLFRRLVATPSLYASDTLLQNFYSAAGQSSVGTFFGIEKGISDLYLLDTVTAAQLAVNDGTISTDLAQVYAIDSTLQAGSLTQQEETALKAERDSLVTDLKTVQTVNDSLWTVIDSTRAVLAGQLKSANAAITPNGIHEENEQIVNEVFLETVAVGVDTFSAQQATDLFAVSVQCPSCGGDAVFRARSLYALHDSEKSFVEPDSCVISRSAAQAPKEKIQRDFAVYPNPASDQVTLVFQADPNGGKKELIVQSITGNILFREAISDEVGKHVVNTSTLSAGAYLIIIYESGIKLHTEQLFIVR